MKRERLLTILSWCAAAASAAAAALLYARLPAVIPMHWGISGAADGFAPRIGAFYTPLLTAGLLLLLQLLPRIDPHRENYARFAESYAAFRLALALFLGLTEASMLCEALRPGTLDIGRVITAGVGLLLCVIGNFMPKFRHNYFVGIRTPWTLADEQVWYATHRLGGRVWFAGGLALAVLAFAVPADSFLAPGSAVLIGALVLVPCVYSFFCYKSRAKH